MGAVAEPVSAWGFTVAGISIGSEGIHKAHVDQTEKETEKAKESIDQSEPGNEEKESQGLKAKIFKHFENKEKEQVQDQNRTQVKSNEDYETEEKFENLIDVEDVIDLANSDKYTQMFLKQFDDEYFCVRTEQRIAYLYIDQAGKIELLEEEPNKCHKIETSEEYLSKVWKKVENQEIVSVQSVKQNVKIPWKLTMKLALQKYWPEGTANPFA